MNIYEPIVQEGYEWINCVNEADYDVLTSLGGQPRSVDWKPVLVRRVSAKGGCDAKESDFPWFGSDVLIMRRKTVDTLRSLLDAHGELLPLATEDGLELFAFNARSIDALDEARSSLMRFPGTNRIMRIMKVSFVTSAVQDVDIFRLPHRASSTYVSDLFVERVRTAGLCGLKFRKVWSD
jgi:hypothetical protein